MSDRPNVITEAVKAGASEIASAREKSAGVQTDLFTPISRKTGAELEKVRERVGAGRPKGAQNLSTRQFREYLLRRGVSPLEQLMRIGMHTPHTLADDLGCEPLEALELLRKVWSDLASYTHAKVQATDDEGRAVPTVVVAVGAAPGAPVIDAIPGARRKPWEYLEVEENQQVSGEAPEASHGSPSHE